MTPQPSTPTPALHIVSADGAAPTTPTTRVPPPSPAPAGDRNAADLRAHLTGAGWADKPEVCLRALRWQQANNLDDVTAAKTIGLPHIMPEMFKRFRECRRPIGVGHHWPELQALTIEAAVQVRLAAATTVVQPDVVTSSPQVTPSPATAATSSKPKPVATDLPSRIRELAQDIVAEMKPRAIRGNKPYTSRTPETARRAAAMMLELGVARGTLATMLGESIGEQGANNKWTMRLYAYETMLKTPTPTTTRPTPAISPTSGPASHPDADLAVVRDAIVRELVPAGKHAKRSAETTKIVVAAAAARATPDQLARTYRVGFAGSTSLGNALALLDANGRGEAPDDKLRKKWVSRVEAYRDQVPAASTPRPAAPKTTEVAPGRSPQAPSVVGRPVLLADGRLRVTVQQPAYDIDLVPGDALWDAALSAVNALTLSATPS